MKNKSIIHNILFFFIGFMLICGLLKDWGGEKREWLQNEMMEYLYPFCMYVDGSAVKGITENIFDRTCYWYLGLCEYMEKEPVYLAKSEDSEMVEWILLQEGRDEIEVTSDEDARDFVKKEGVSENGTVSEDTLKDVDLNTKKEAMDEENEAKRNEFPGIENGAMKDARRTKKVWKSDGERVAYLESLKDFDNLKKEFYQIDKNTSITAEQLDAAKMFQMDLSLQHDASEPQILIYHTHSQEAFADSALNDPNTSVVGAGERLSELLREYGFNVIHHTGEYDVNNRDYAYSNAAPAIEKLLEENPSIEVIIDLHRDGVDENTHLVTEIDGVRMAQFMFFNGLSHTNKTGDIEYLKNPYIQDNLALSFQLQLAAREYYPGLARRIYLKGYRYNMHYRSKSILIELGAQTNTVEEIWNALPPIAHLLNEVLSDKEAASDADLR